MSLFSSARWIGVSQATKVLSQIISVVVLAKILHPVDYGICTLAMVVTNFAYIFRDMGTSSAIIHRKHLKEGEKSTIFWFNIAVGVAICIFLAGTSYTISQFYNQPRLFNLLLILSLIFPIMSASIVHQALLEKSSRFKSIAIMESVCQVTGLIMAIIFALNGAGVYSLIVPMVLTAILNGIWLWSISDWRPKFHWSTEEFKSIIGFSGNLSLFNFMEYFSTNADSMLIGKFFGAATLGAYSLTYKIMLLPIQNLTGVMNRILLPSLCNARDDKNATKDMYFKSLNFILTISAPLMVGLWALRDPFIHSIFGEKWNLIPLLLTWLAPVGLFQSVIHTTGIIFTAYGKTKLLLKLGLFALTMNLCAFYLGVHFGVVELTMFYFIVNSVNLYVCSQQVLKALESTFAEMYLACRWPLVAAGIMGLILFIFETIMVRNHIAASTNLIGGIAIGVTSYFLVIYYVSRASFNPILKLMKLRT